MRFSLSLSLSLLLSGFCADVAAQNLVSRPVGFIRLAVSSNAAPVTVPFHPLATSSNAVLTWDAARQEYTAAAIAPGCPSDQLMGPR